MEKEEPYRKPKYSEGYTIPMVMETDSLRQENMGGVGWRRAEEAGYPNTKSHPSPHGIHPLP